MLLMMSNYFRQFIAGKTVTKFLRYQIRRRVTNSSALEYILTVYAINLIILYFLSVRNRHIPKGSDV